MRWVGRDPYRWRRGFALLPMRPIGAQSWVWLEPYWWRPDGGCTAVRFTPPCAALAAAIPIPMILFCPACGVQHIDAPEPSLGPRFQDPGRSDEWTNPPHRSHLCAGCGHIWRPADVATEGVAAILTRGKHDHEHPLPTPPLADTTERQPSLRADQ